MSSPGPSAFRRRLRAGIAASAAPYGYTITIWSSGAVSMDLLGQPGAPEALLYVLGAVTAFLVVEVAAYGEFRIHLAPEVHPRMAAWGSAHFLASGGAVLGVWGADSLLEGQRAGWPVAGFVATSLYLILNAVQTTLASRARPRDAD